MPLIRFFAAPPIVGCLVFAVGRGGAARSQFELPVAGMILATCGFAGLVAEAHPELVTLILALLVAASALFGLVFNAAAQRREAERLRAERRGDVQRALRTEIEAHLADHPTTDWPALQRRAADAFAADPAYSPYVPPRERDRLFARLVDRIELPEAGQIEPVVRYHTVAAQIVRLAQDMRTPEHVALDTDRRARVFHDYLALEETLIDRGRLAVAALRSPAAGVSRTDRARSDLDTCSHQDRG